MGCSATVPSLASRLCLSCSLCCDGTLHGYAVIKDAEVEETAALGLDTFTTAAGQSAFAFPCHYLEGKACTRYDSWRPSICGDYFCRVQARVASEELTEQQAFALVHQARGLRDEVASLLPPGMPMVEAREHFRKLAADRHNLGPQDAKLVVRMFVMERLLDSEFRGKGAGHLPS
ncbi:MAG: hypothetical protein ACK4Z8_07600 [Novosphingobium sp.]